MRLLKVIALRVGRLPKYNSFAQLDTWLVAVIGAASFLEGSFYGWVIGETFPDFWKVARTLPFADWGLEGWAILLILACIGVNCWVFGSIAKRCNDILQERLFA